MITCFSRIRSQFTYTRWAWVATTRYHCIVKTSRSRLGCNQTRVQSTAGRGNSIWLRHCRIRNPTLGSRRSVSCRQREGLRRQRPPGFQPKIQYRKKRRNTHRWVYCYCRQRRYHRWRISYIYRRRIGCFAPKIAQKALRATTIVEKTLNFEIGYPL